MKKTNNKFLISQQNDDSYGVWVMDLKNPELFTNVLEKAAETLSYDDHIMQVGNFVLQWSALNSDEQYNYRLLEFNAGDSVPLGSSKKDWWSSKAVQSGYWPKKKFFGSRADFSNPTGAKKGYESGKEVILVSMHNFVLNWIPTPGRGTYKLFNFDNGSTDPLPNNITPQGAWLTIQSGHELVYACGYVIDWVPETGSYDIWQFDAQDKNPLSYPAVKKGSWKDMGISKDDQLLVLGELVIAWNSSTNAYKLFEFDLKEKNALKFIKQGTLPKEIVATTKLTAIETLIPIDKEKVNEEGTVDFMRDKIEHVVYYMIENRSFDHVCGWLYDKKANIKIVGKDQGPFKGVDPNFTNEFEGEKYAITQYNKGKLSEKTEEGKPFNLDLDENDPYHDNSDVMRQMFSQGIEAYEKKKTPEMGGFALNNGTSEVMLGYSKEQLPVLNGLGENFAISDDWFCSMPGGTDVNRAFSLTGSSLNNLNNFQNGVEYTEWSEYPHRPSIWKVLWSNGINSFKIYNAVEWIGCQFTYNLFLKGQIPSIDNPFVSGNYAPQLNQFYDDLKYGTLPAFSFVEPKWVASAGSTSYHPGNDLIPGERTLNDIFNAIQESPLWDKILFVITFDEHGGIADHVPPPYAKNPFVNDSIEGFNFDVMGVRIPTILVSPWISKNTVFRTTTDTSFCSTSILSTLLNWFGVPKSRWGLGERTNESPTFENVLLEKEARKDKVKLDIPWDATFPKPKDDVEDETVIKPELPVHGLHELVVPRMVADMTPNLSRAERLKLEEEILSTVPNLEALHKRLDELHTEHNK